jgi:SAM-dependent methyltransferase
MEYKTFIDVTERGGEKVSQAQLTRFYQRYIWAGTFCNGKDVLEVACGTGPGLSYLQSVSKTLIAGDYSEEVLAVAREQYGTRISLHQFDACVTPFDERSFDVIILFEAIYYLSDVTRFFAECRRLLRSGGRLLLATANKDLSDFNPSAFSIAYYNPPELQNELNEAGFDSCFLGGSPIDQAGRKNQVIHRLKKFAVRLNLIPKSMNGKRLFKRLVFGNLVTMPKELILNNDEYIAPISIDSDRPDKVHQVIYCVATLR